LSAHLEGAREASSPTMTLTTSNDTSEAKSTSGVPPRRVNDSFGSFRLGEGMREAFDQCQRVAKGDAWCALLMGGPGTGKTHLAVATMQSFGLARSRFWKVPDFLEWLKDMAYGKDYGLDPLLTPYRTGDFLLVLDDLGVEKSTDWAAEQLYRVLDSRYDNELPTVITTNQGRDRIDPRILSRYAEGLVACRGKDERRKA
jgi:DNA replication protein DnaC